jgi:hypothetical protein
MRQATARRTNQQIYSPAHICVIPVGPVHICVIPVHICVITVHICVGTVHICAVTLCGALVE